MSDSKMPASPSTQAAVPLAGTRSWRSRIERYAVVSVVVTLAALIGLELLARQCRTVSISRLKAFAKSIEQGQTFPGTEVERHLVGWRFRKEGKYNNSKLLTYTWPSLLSACRLRVRESVAGHIICMDTNPDENEDFMAPFLTYDQNGVSIVDKPGEESPIPVQAPVDLIARVNQVFARPPEPIAPGIVIFPVVDDQDRITTTGAALSMTAQNSAVSTPAKRMALDPRVVRRTLIETGTWLGGTKLNQRNIELCLAAIGVHRYARPRIVTRDGKQQLILELHGSPTGIKPTFIHDVSDQNSPLIPGLMALDLLDHLKVSLSNEERTWILAPQFQKVTDAEAYVQKAERTEFDFMVKNQFRYDHLRQNPNWVAAWDLYCDSTRDRSSGGRELPKTQAVRESGTIAQDLGQTLTPEQQFLSLLDLAPSLRGEALYHSQLLWLATARLDKKLAEDLVPGLFAIWEREDNSYASRVERARVWISWAWDARGSRAAASVSTDAQRVFLQRLENARHELDQAILSNPQGWAAHAELIRVAQGLGLGMDFVQQHFERAVSILPLSRGAYRAKRWYLEKKWNGTNERLYQFADECLANEHWERGIPQFVPELLKEIVFVPELTINDLELQQAPAYWNRVEGFWRSAQKHYGQQIPADVTNFYAFNAAATGHFAEAAAAFDQLDIETVGTLEAFEIENFPPPVKTDYRVAVFGSDACYHELRDLVHANTRHDIVGKLAAIRSALADNRLPDAERLLKEAEPKTDADRVEIDRLSRALTFGKRLAQERQIHLTPKEALELFAEVQRLSCQGISQDSRWQVEGNRLVYNSPGYSRSLGWVLHTWIYFPVGTRECKISGILDYAGHLAQIELIFRAGCRNLNARVIYSPPHQKIRLSRNGFEMGSAIMPASPFEFSIESDSKRDNVSPVPGLEWQTEVLADAPSTFGFGMWRTGLEPIKFSIRDLKVEQLN
ncbi:MAG: hypothetical protein JWM11_6254 [Planctomycetaceae bacterium]|nr:hypothetical protein [Planctomycetaceae bacterium]